MESIRLGQLLPITIKPQLAVTTKPTAVEVALRALSELSVSLALTLAIDYFVGMPLSVACIAAMMLTCAAQIIWRLGCYLVSRWEGVSFQDLDSKASWFAKFSVVNIFGLTGPSIAIHEMGHALMALTLFKGSRPHISVTPFEGGWTTFKLAHLSRLGSLLGMRTSLALVMAGGLIASTVTAMVGMTLSHYLKDSYPTVSRFLELFAYVQLFNDILYGCLLYTSPSPRDRG